MFKNQNQLVAEIHNEFDTAQERLLNEAREIINQTSLNTTAERLEKIGFVNSDIVVKNRGARRVLAKNVLDAQLIEYYKESYPFQKFITEEELDRICKKYNLIYAPVANYKKNVPEKNLREIESVGKLKTKDNPKNIYRCKLTLENFIIGGHEFLSMFWPLWWKLPRIINGNFNSQYDVDRFINEDVDTGFEYIVRRIRNIEINKQGLFIAAPKSHFNLKGLSKEGLLHANYTIVAVKDPIVFRFCMGGVQIISKWGLESEDASLVNEKLN
jgi:hypothetical protein